MSTKGYSPSDHIRTLVTPFHKGVTFANMVWGKGYVRESLKVSTYCGDVRIEARGLTEQVVLHLDPKYADELVAAIVAAKAEAVAERAA